ncbi:MAG: hypothetical protein ACRDSJ_07815 [Rubrobacteraceae bacterium]
MANQEKANKAAEKLARTTRDSYQTVLDHVVGVQERNVRFAQSVVDDSIKEFRHQAESNRAMTQELVERTEKQRDAYQALVQESVDAYMDFAYAPFEYYKKGLEVAEEAVEKAAPNGEVPIADYDQLNVEQVKVRTEKLSAAQIRRIRDYEKKHKNRETLVEQFDKKLKATSA